MKGQPLSGAMKMLGNDERRQNPEAAVKLSGVGHRVVVRTNDQSPCGVGGARISADNIADGIDLGRKSSRTHPVAQPRRRRFMRRGKIRASQTFGRLRE